MAHSLKLGKRYTCGRPGPTSLLSKSHTKDAIQQTTSTESSLNDKIDSDEKKRGYTINLLANLLQQKDKKMGFSAKETLQGKNNAKVCLGKKKMRFCTK